MLIAKNEKSLHKFLYIMTENEKRELTLKSNKTKKPITPGRITHIHVDVMLQDLEQN